MLSLQSDHITDLYVFVDDLLPPIEKPHGGRPSVLSDSELLTILLWNVLAIRQRTIKDMYRWVHMYHAREFPHLPKYNAFLEQCHRAIPQMWRVLEQILATDTPIRIMDSTMIPVCRLARANTHKVAQGIAQFGKNHQGWHYGFKLHLSTNFKGLLCGVVLTPANTHDAQRIPYLVDKHTKVAVGDGTYNARVMREHIWNTYGTIIIAPPHPKQKRKVLARWQYVLLLIRPKIESVFDYLKEHLGLVTSFPRSVNGYLFHYLRILLGYQLMTM